MFIRNAKQKLVFYAAEISTQAAASAQPMLSSSTEIWSKQYIGPAIIIRHCKEQIHTKMLRCPLLRSYLPLITARHLLKTGPALSLLFSISQLKKLKHTVNDFSHVTEVSSHTRNKSWVTITVTLLFGVSLMSAQGEKKNQKPKNQTPYLSQSNFINISQEQIAAFYWEKTTALCTTAELGKLHTKMTIMQIYLMNIFREEWSRVYFL